MVTRLAFAKVENGKKVTGRIIRLLENLCFFMYYMYLPRFHCFLWLECMFYLNAAFITAIGKVDITL